MHCEQAETLLAALIYGQLDSKRKAALLEHMATCMKCSSLLAGMRSVSGVLKEAIESGEPPKLSRQRRAALLRVAAARKRKDAATKKVRMISKKIKSIFPPLTRPIRIPPILTRPIHLPRWGSIAALLAFAFVAAAFLMPTLSTSREMAKSTLASHNANQVPPSSKAPADVEYSAGDQGPSTEIGANWEDWDAGGASAGEETQIAATTDDSGPVRGIGGLVAYIAGIPSPGGVPAANAKANAPAITGVAPQASEGGLIAKGPISRATRGTPTAAGEAITAPPEGRIVVKHLQEKYDTILKGHDKQVLITNGRDSTGGGALIGAGIGGGKEAARSGEREGGRGTIQYRNGKAIVLAPLAVKARILEHLQTARRAERDRKAPDEGEVSGYFKALPDDPAPETWARGSGSNEKPAEGLVRLLKKGFSGGEGTVGRLSDEWAGLEIAVPKVGVQNGRRRKAEIHEAESDGKETLDRNGEAEKLDRDLAPKPRPGGADLPKGWAVIDALGTRSPVIPLGGGRISRKTPPEDKSAPTRRAKASEEKLKDRKAYSFGKAGGRAGDATFAKDLPPTLSRAPVGRLYQDGGVFGPAATEELPPAKTKGKKSGGFFGFLKKKGLAYHRSREVPPQIPAINARRLQGGAGGTRTLDESDQAAQHVIPDAGVMVKRRSLEGEHNRRIAELVKEKDRIAAGEPPLRSGLSADVGRKGGKFGVGFSSRATWRLPPGGAGAAGTSPNARERFDSRNYTDLGGMFIDKDFLSTITVSALLTPATLEGLHNQRIAELVKDRDKAAGEGRPAEAEKAPAFVKLSPEEAQRDDDRKLAEATVDGDRRVDGESIESEATLVVEEELTEDEPMPPAVFKLVPVNPFVMTQKDRFSTFALDVDTASYALARSYIRRGYLPPAGSVRMEEFVNAFDYNYPKHTENVFTVHAEGMPSPFGRGLVLLKIGVQGRALGREGRKPAHLVFVIDASGSMARPDRLPLVQHGLALLAEQLDDRDRVSLVTFGSGANLLLQGVPAADRQRILAAVNSIRCGGSTNLLQGVELGYAVAAREFRAGEINRVILCSDGVANIGLTDADDMLQKVEAFKKQGISFTSIGFGTGSYNDELLEKLANKGDGTYAFIATRGEARRVFVEQMATLQTIAGDAKIQVEFDPARVRRYRLIGYENRDVADKDFRNDAIDAGEVGSGQSATALYELELLQPAAGCLPGDLGTVYVRYRNLDTNKVEEISSRLESSLIRQRTALAAPRLYLAAAAAEFAEVLRESEHARDGSFDGVRSIVERVAVALPLDQRVADLLDLVTRAKGLPRAQ